MIDSSIKQKVVHTAKQLWDKDNLIEAGMVLFERIPLSFRPLWGVDILTFASQRISDIAQIKDVITFARTPEEWANNTSSGKGEKAHSFFDSVRLLP